MFEKAVEELLTAKCYLSFYLNDGIELILKAILPLKLGRPPETVSARSRRSYGKIGNCEQPKGKANVIVN